MELDEFRLHHRGDRGPGIRDQQPVDRQQSLEPSGIVNHEQLVGVVRHFIEPAQVAQDDLDGNIVADADHVEIHQRADRVLGVRHRRAQLLAFLGRQRLEDVLHHLAREIGREIGDLVGVELFGRRDQLLLVHVRDQRLAHGVRDFEQDLAFAIGLDQIPHHETLLERQRLQDVGDVRRVLRVEQLLQLDEMELVHQVLDQLLARPFLPLDEALHQLVLVQEFAHAPQAVVHTRAGFVEFGHE